MCNKNKIVKLILVLSIYFIPIVIKTLMSDQFMFKEDYNVECMNMINYILYCVFTFVLLICAMFDLKREK